MASRAVETARLSAHPRARRQIHRAKGWAALAGLVFGVVFARRAGLPWFDAGVRGLTLGVVAWLAAWG
nr:hypothetical protein [Solirubrobacterales bacterium]